MRSIEQRNELVEQHLSLAKRMADKKYAHTNKTVQHGELLSAAYSGLIDAAEKYDSHKIHKLANKPFECYARVRIFGEMNDYLRSCNWGTRNNYVKPVSIEADAYNKNSSSDMAVTNIRDTLVNRDRSIPTRVNGEQIFDKIIHMLSQRERKVFKLRFFYDLTMKDIANTIGITESRVSQIISNSIELLREVWGDKAHELWNEIED